MKLFHSMPQPEFERAVSELDAAIPTLEPHQIVVRLQQITARVGDGHTGVHTPEWFQVLPIALFWFGDTLRVTAAAKGYERALGTRVVQIGELPIADVESRVRTCFPSAADENEWYAMATSPAFITRPEVLQALGVISDRAHAPFTFETTRDRSSCRRNRSPRRPQHSARQLAVGMVPVAPPPLEAEAWRSSGFTMLPDSTAYVNWRSYEGCDKARELFRPRPASVKRLVVDMRQNGGGDFFEGRKHLIEPIKKRPALNQKGRLYVIVGRRTFSAALANAVDFRKDTNATLVGEPIGERPNSYSENDELTLPNSRLVISFSTRYKFVDIDVPDPTCGSTPTGQISARGAIRSWSGSRSSAERSPAVDRSPATSRLESELREESGPARVAVEGPELWTALGFGDTGIADRVRPLEPLERRLCVTDHRVHLGDLIRAVVGVFLDQLAECSLRFRALAACGVDDRQGPEAKELVRLRRRLDHGFVDATRRGQGEREKRVRQHAAGRANTLRRSFGLRVTAGHVEHHAEVMVRASQRILIVHVAIAARTASSVSLDVREGAGGAKAPVVSGAAQRPVNRRVRSLPIGNHGTLDPRQSRVPSVIGSSASDFSTARALARILRGGPHPTEAALNAPCPAQPGQGTQGPAPQPRQDMRPFAVVGVASCDQMARASKPMGLGIRRRDPSPLSQPPRTSLLGGGAYRSESSCAAVARPIRRSRLERRCRRARDRRPGPEEVAVRRWAELHRDANAPARHRTVPWRRVATFSLRPIFTASSVRRWAPTCAFAAQARGSS